MAYLTEKVIRGILGRLDTIDGAIRGLRIELDDLRRKAAPVQPYIQQTDMQQTVEVGGDWAAAPADLGFSHRVLLTADCAVTLPDPIEGKWIEYEVTGNYTLTVKNTAGTAIGEVRQYERSRIPCLTNSGEVSAWPTVIVVYGASGEIRAGDVVVDDSNKGFIWLAPDGNLWRGVINNSGALVTGNLGTTKPAPEEPI